jgi:hypothetical protein
MNEDDVLGGAVREPLRACCLKLAARLWALCQQAGFGDAKALQAGLAAQLWQRGALQDQPLRRECAHGEPSSPPAMPTARMPAHPPKSNVQIPPRREPLLRCAVQQTPRRRRGRGGWMPAWRRWLRRWSPLPLRQPAACRLWS